MSPFGDIPTYNKQIIKQKGNRRKRLKGEIMYRLISDELEGTLILNLDNDEIVKEDPNVFFEVHDMNAAVHVYMFDRKGMLKHTGPYIGYDSINEILAEVTGDDEWLDYINDEDEVEDEE